MAKATPPLVSFNSGEVSPLVDLRSDIDKYFSACRALQNMVPIVEGAARKMPGTYYVAAAKTASGNVRLVPFHFSSSQAYVLEFTANYIRFFKDRGQIVVDTSMDNFDPSSAYFYGEFASIGPYTSRDFGGGKFLYVVAPLGQSGAVGISISIQSNTANTLVCSKFGASIAINLADTTPAKNAANLIQVAVRALSPVNGVDVTGWTITENAAYAAARPTSGVGVSPSDMAANGKYYRCIIAIAVSATNTNYFPPIEVAYWLEVTLGESLEIVTPYADGNLFDLQIGPASADTLYITHPSYASRKLLRHSHIQWELKELACVDKNSKVVLDVANLLNPAVSCLNHKFKATDVVYFDEIEGMTELNGNSYSVYTIVDDNEFRITVNTAAYGIYKTGGFVALAITGISKAVTAVVTMPRHGLDDGNKVKIVGVKGMTQVNGNVYTVANKTSSTFELLGIDSTGFTTYTSSGTAQRVLFTSTGDYPACAEFHDQRLFLAGSDNEPQTPRASVVGDFENFTQDVESDDAALEYKLVSTKVDRIRWMASDNYLILGTVGGETKLGASDPNGAITATNVSTRRQIDLGASNVTPIRMVDSLIWVTRDGRSVRQASWSWQLDRYEAPNLTRLAAHITLGASAALSGIKQMDSQQSPLPILWCIRKDGQLLGMTYEVIEKVYAWFRVKNSGANDTFESVAVIKADSTEDEVWVVAKRYLFSSGELMSNGAFATDLTGWNDHDSLSGVSVWSAGTMRLTSGTEGTASRDQHVTVVSGTTYTFSFDLVAGSQAVVLNIGTTHGGSELHNQTYNTVGTYTITGVVASGTTMYIKFYNYEDMPGFSGSITAYIDNVSLMGWGYGKYIEYFKPHEFFSTIADAFFVHSGLSGTLVSATQITGLTHLPGRTVSVMIAGVYIGDFVVSSGGIVTLGGTYSGLAHAGLPYTPIVEPMKLNAGSPLGSARGKKQKVHKVTVVLHNSCKAKIGPDLTHLVDIPELTDGTLFTGDKTVDINGDWQDEATLVITQDTPYPLTVLGLIPHLTVNEDA